MTTRTSSIEIAVAPSRATAALQMVAVAVGYYLLAEFSLELALVDGAVSPVWFASGLAMAALCRWGVRLWPGVFVGSLVTNLVAGLGWTVVPIAVGNTLEPVCGALLLRMAGFNPRLRSPQDVLWLAVLGSGSATMLSATIGVTSICATGMHPWSEFPGVWLTWWLGDGQGVLIACPLFLLLPLSRLQWPARSLELAAAVVTITLLAVLVFVLAADPRGVLSPLSFLIWPVLMWPIFRFRQLGAALSVMACGLVAVVGAVSQLNGLNDFLTLNHHVIFLQGFMGTTAITAMALGAAVDQYRTASRSLRLTQHAVDSAGDPLLWLDHRGRIAYANAAFARLIDRPLDLLMGAPFLDWVGGIEDGEWWSLEKAAAQDRPVVRQLDLHRHDAEPIPVELTVTRLVHEGRDYSCLVMRDLSERKRLEDHLAQSQKMEAIGRLAGGIAHDFNNMLAALSGNAELLQSELEARGHESRHLTNILLSCQRARDLTDQLLVFSRGDRNEQRVIELNGAVQQAVDLHRRVISETIAIEHRPGSGNPLVKADASRIQQLVMNLMLNARDAMPGGGRILIETVSLEVTERECAEMPQARPGEFHRLRVSDTGSGIDPKVLGRIFEPFFSTKDPGRGTGLGLAIVHGIVQRSGGFVAVSSPPGGGATFDVYLPAVSSDRETTNAERLATAQIARIGRGRHALLVEDDDQVLEMVQKLLQQAGFNVSVARNGKDGLRMVDQDPGGYDLIVTDLVMPDLGGVDMATGIRERSGTIPVLFMSAYPEQADDETDRERQAPNTAFIGKPFAIQDFAKAVKDLLHPRPRM